MKFYVALISLICTLAAPAARADVLVFAAASLKEPLDQIAEQFDDVTMSYGGSGTLARQVSLGAPADVVLLANTAWMDVLIEGAHVRPDTVGDFASNRLVLVGASASAPITLDADSLLAALGGQRLAIGLTEAVPAGIYAKAALQALDLWDVLASQLAEVDNVRVALAMVARGQAPLGVVYRTDLSISPDLVELAVFPQSSHPPIRYMGGVVTESNDDAESFWDYVRSPQGQAILAEAGFLPPIGPQQ